VATIPWDVVYYKDDDNAATVPSTVFLAGCPTKVEATMLAVLTMVAAAPPPAFSGGGKWGAMHGDMGGYYEVRVTGPKREQFRLFCRLDNSEDTAEMAKRGLPNATIAVITGMRKPFMTTFTAADYKRVRNLGDKYLASFPRSIAV
jgi:hypothetical protein